MYFATPQNRAEPDARRRFVMLPHFVSARARTTSTHGLTFLADTTQELHHRDSGAVSRGHGTKIHLNCRVSEPGSGQGFVLLPHFLFRTRPHDTHT